ncbi:MAG: DUF47 family protein [Candidatus Sericytochromatia bacterium]|nr:DUF47 family protein [Candidatus Sericytochromatia bacterium]
MVLRIDELIGSSHADEIQIMIRLSTEALQKIPLLFEAVSQQDLAWCQKLSDAVSDLEHQIDIHKHQLRQKLSRSLFFALPRRDFIDFVLQLDGISDACERLAKTLTYRTLGYPDSLKSQVGKVISDLLQHASFFAEIIEKELPALFDTSFGGAEAQAVAAMLDSQSEKMTDLSEKIHLALVSLFTQNLSVPELLIWQKAIHALESIGINIEKSASALRALLEK